VDGPLHMGVEMRLTPAQALQARSWFETPGTDVRLGRGIQIRQLQSHVNLEKQYLIKKEAKERSGEPGGPPSLSRDVLESLAGEVTASEMEDRVTRRFVDDLRGRGMGRPSLSFEYARLETAALPIELAHHALDFHLVKGLPSVDYLQVDLLGGTVVGALSVRRSGRGFGLNAKGSFSGINAKRLLAEAIQGVPDEQAEINGQFSVAMPLSTQLSTLLSGLRLDLRLTRIGSQALERVLYALDPYEHNEAIVNQRKQLRMGTPRWIHVRIQNGSLSMRGEVEVKGVRLEIPPIERLNLAHLSGMRRLEDALGRLDPLLGVLHILAASAVVIDDQGKLQFVSDRLQ
jgi:translocation and assembly module TamB